eukprot:Ihof_evm3s170 gene=Ihof_evmTU3s170
MATLRTHIPWTYIPPITPPQFHARSMPFTTPSHRRTDDLGPTYGTDYEVTRRPINGLTIMVPNISTKPKEFCHCTADTYLIINFCSDLAMFGMYYNLTDCFTIPPFATAKENSAYGLQYISQQESQARHLLNTSVNCHARQYTELQDLKCQEFVCMGLRNTTWMEVVQHFRQYELLYKIPGQVHTQEDINSLHQHPLPALSKRGDHNPQHEERWNSNRPSKNFCYHKDYPANHTMKECSLNPESLNFGKIIPSNRTNKSNPFLIAESKPLRQIHLSSTAPRTHSLKHGPRHGWQVSLLTHSGDTVTLDNVLYLLEAPVGLLSLSALTDNSILSLVTNKSIIVYQGTSTVFRATTHLTHQLCVLEATLQDVPSPQLEDSFLNLPSTELSGATSLHTWNQLLEPSTTLLSLCL